jgi:hypothetical protein
MRTIRTVVAAAVVCAAALSGCTATSRPLPASVPADAPGGVPRYFVVVAGLEVVVRASGDGHVTGSVAIPVPAGTARSPVGGEAYGGADDQHFVIVVSRGGDLPGVAGVTLFRLAVSPGGRPGRLGQLAFDSTGVPVTGAALSPDGRMLALSLTREFPPGGALAGSVELISVVTGATRTWTGRGAPGYWPGVPSWAGNGTVIVPWWHSVSQSMVPAELTGVRELDAAAPGGNLAAARLVAFPAPVPDLGSAMIAPGGGNIIASSCRAGQRQDTATAQVTELSATNGRLVRVLRTQTARFRDDADVQQAIQSACRILSVTGDGGDVLIEAFAFGRIDNGAFISLPGTSPDALPISATW